MNLSLKYTICTKFVSLVSVWQRRPFYQSSMAAQLISVWLLRDYSDIFLNGRPSKMVKLLSLLIEVPTTILYIKSAVRYYPILQTTFLQVLTYLLLICSYWIE